MSIAEKLVTIAENEQRVYNKGLTDGQLNGWHDGYDDGKKEGYSEGYELGSQHGFTDGYRQGWDDAVTEGTITILDTTKELKIEGLLKAPKTLNLLATTIGNLGQFPEDYYLVRGLDYFADGYYQGNSTQKRLLNLWLVGVTGQGANVSISEGNATSDKLITFENGVLTLKNRESTPYYYGKNFTFKWVATF